MQPIIQLLLLLIHQCSSQIIASSINELINGDFSSPSLKSLNTLYVFYPSSIPGWNCTSYCQVDDCLKFRKYMVSINKMFAGCSGQAIDLNSYSRFEVVSQQVTLKASAYQLTFSYYYPPVSANRKTIKVYFNKQLVFIEAPQTSSLYKQFIVSLEVQGIEGINNLAFTMSGLNDGSGFVIANVSLSRKYPIFEHFFNISLKNPAIKYIFSHPGFRILFSEFIGFFISFDRLEFYWFHKRKYSQNLHIFLSNVQQIKSIQGDLLRKVIFKQLLEFIDSFQTKIDSLNYKVDYFSKLSGSVEETDFSFLLNNQNFLLYSFPIILITVLLGNFLFALSRRWAISRIFRRYFFGGILLLMMLEGNVEQITFYMLAELRFLFAFRTFQKLISFALLLTFAIIVISAISCFAWFKFCYRKLVYYFVENYRSNIFGLLTISFDRGLICIAFGAIHQLLITAPSMQLLILGGLEIIWIFSRLIGLGLGVYRFQKSMVWMGVIESLARIVLQISCYLYEDNTKSLVHRLLNDEVHFLLMVIFLSIWILQLLLGVTSIFIEMAHFLPTILSYQKKKKQLTNVEPQKIMKVKEHEFILSINKKMKQSILEDCSLRLVKHKYRFSINQKIIDFKPRESLF